jgi:branched-chain amino acid transport system ATP-binding protein
LVEQNVSRALAVSERTYVLENGRIVSSGPSDVIASQPEIKKAYLGL